VSAREIMISLIREIAIEQKKTLAPLDDDDLELVNSGLDSLCFAILVARLEDATGVDPFVRNEAMPMTLGEFVALYDRSAKPTMSGGNSRADSPLSSRNLEVQAVLDNEGNFVCFRLDGDV